MIDNNKDAQKLLVEFLDKFSPVKLASINLEDYTGTATDGKRDDFTYWVEIKLDALGGIKGGSSYKFGIYKCNTKPKERNGYKYDENSKYAWVDNIIKDASYNDVF